MYAKNPKVRTKQNDSHIGRIKKGEKPQGEVLFIGTVDRKVERGGMEGDGGF